MTATTASDLELSIRAALDRSPEIDSFDLRVHVLDGRIELSGTVGSYAERLSVRNVAATCAPAIDIADLVHVRATFDTLRVTDAELLEAGRAALHAAAIPVALMVTQRVATLIGHVGTEDARRRARHAVESVPGVNFVDNQLSIG